jgi:hypothetical protein
MVPVVFVVALSASDSGLALGFLHSAETTQTKAGQNRQGLDPKTKGLLRQSGSLTKVPFFSGHAHSCIHIRL